jgi:hypothetical protein
LAALPRFHEAQEEGRRKDLHEFTFALIESRRLWDWFCIVGASRYNAPNKN